MSSSQCYYPNGDPSQEDDIPCSSSSGGVACCPSGWTCQNNGLCYLQNQQYYGRYTCTDKSWQSSGCPDICTHGNTANGNEAVLECSTGSYCCDANRPELSGGQPCCDTTSDRFSIQNMAMVNNTDGSSAAPSSVAASSAAASSGGDLVLSAAASSAAASVEVSTLFSTLLQSSPTSLNSGSQSSTPAKVATIVIISTETAKAPSSAAHSPSEAAAASSTPSSSSIPIPASHSSTPVGAIVGGVVGGIAAIAFVILAILLLLRHRRRSKRDGPDSYSPNSQFEPMYKDPTTPLSPATDKSPELEGSSPASASGMFEKRRSPRTYQTPSEVGRSPTTSTVSSNRALSALTRSSWLSRNPPPPVPPSIAELPADDPSSLRPPRPLSELPERSVSQRTER